MFVLISKFKQRYFVFLFLFMAFLLSFTADASAATLSFSPSSSSVSAGNIISARVVVNTLGEAINNAEASIQFPSNLLEVVSVSKSSSIFSLWVEEPTFSNSSGTVRFNGGVANPGYSGSNGSLVSITFRAKKPGTASILFADAAVRKNDGLGTDILTGAGQASFNISKAVEKVAPVVEPAPTPVSEVAPTIVIVSVPVFTDYSKDIKEGEFLVVKGLADSSTDIFINSDGVLSATGEGVHDSVTIKSNDKGIFAYVSERAKSGTYLITAQARSKNSIFSEKTLPIKISVVSPSAPRNIVDTLSTIIPIISLIILLILILVVIWSWYYILHYREHMRKKMTDIRNITSKSFNILDEDVKDEIKIFKKIKALEALTSEERLFINQFKKDIEAAEKVILNEVKE